MNMTRRPMLATVFYGLMCGVFFIPANVVLSYMMSWPVAFRLIIWLYMTWYAVLLTRWAKVRAFAIVFPLLVLLPFVFWGGSSSAFLLLTLGILSWIRSGVCFQGSLAKVLGAELVACVGGGVLVAYFAPHSTVAWAMAVWMFFLVQSLYFIVAVDAGNEGEKVELDPFEKARRQAERILSHGTR